MVIPIDICQVCTQNVCPCLFWWTLHTHRLWDTGGNVNISLLNWTPPCSHLYQQSPRAKPLANCLSEHLWRLQNVKGAGVNGFHWYLLTLPIPLDVMYIWSLDGGQTPTGLQPCSTRWVLACSHRVPCEYLLNVACSYRVPGEYSLNVACSYRGPGEYLLNWSTGALKWCYCLKSVLMLGY